MMLIDEYHFGKIVIAGKPYDFDLMICGEELYQKWWRKEGHSLCLEDLEWILDRTPEILIIGKGSVGCMEVPIDLVEELGKRGIEVRIAKTGQAVELYDEMARKETRKIGAVFHLTC